MARRFAVSIFCLLSVLGLSRYIYLEEFGNFHEVSTGLVYRSAQLDEDELARYIDKYGIRAIVNLRGKKENKEWYKQEISVAKSKGVTVLNYRLSPRNIVSPLTIEKVLKLMRNAPKPILVHCKAGADRSGLIAAVWKLVIDKEPPEKAHKQLSLFYGHVPYLWSKTKAMDESFWNYVRYIRSRKQNQSADRAASKQDYWWRPKAETVHLSFSRKSE